MNWWKTAQSLSTDSFDAHPDIVDMKRHLSADDENGDPLDIYIIPIISEGKGYLTVQLDARHGGQVPKSAALAKLHEAVLTVDGGLNSNKFVDDHFFPLEADLPTGAYKVSRMEKVLGPGSRDALHNAMMNIVASWVKLADRLVDLDLIRHYYIYDAKERVVADRSSKSENKEFENVYQNDISQMDIFVCRLNRFEMTHPELRKWTNDLRQAVTDWKWSAIHEKKYPHGKIDESMCERKLDQKWIARFSDDLSSPGREIFLYACGQPEKNHDAIMEIAKGMPEDAMSKNGVEQFIYYLGHDEDEAYIANWIRDIAQNPSMLSKNIIGHPWAVEALRKSHPALADKLDRIQKGIK